MARIAVRHAGDGFGRAFSDDASTLITAPGAEIDDPISGLDDLQIVLNDDNRVSGSDQGVEHLQEFLHILEM